MPQFTAQNAREMAARAHEARRQRTAERETPPQTLSQQDANDSYIPKRLARVRKQLDRLDDMIEEETDPMKLDRLASAQTRLSEQERVLAGRPMPGSLRPRPDRKNRTGPAAGAMPEPTPIVDLEPSAS